MKRLMLWSALLLIVLGLMACMDMGEEETKLTEEEAEAETVTSMRDQREEAGSQVIHVELINADGVEIGTAQLSQLEGGVEIQLEASHLPSGVHGYHIHEKGICEPPSFESAGGHFNPTDAKHGFDHPEGPHAGDLPNIEVKEDGRVQFTYINPLVTLHHDEPNSLLQADGTSIVIHAKRDDYQSQPAGDSGDRIACGVIRQ